MNTVLLIDDDENLLEALQRQLHAEPFRTITTQSGKEALEILNSVCVDVVVSDQEMPGLKGTQFLWQVKMDFPKIIRFMLTGQATKRAASLALKELGVMRFFTKPCDATDLSMSIRQALQQRDLMVETMRLLKKIKQQKAFVDQLKLKLPGMSSMTPSAPEDIHLDGDLLNKCDALIEEAREALGTSSTDKEMEGEPV